MNFITQDVLYTSGDIKREAKAQLQGNWRSAVILALIPSLFSVFFIGTTARDPMNQTLLEDLVDMLLNIIHTFLLIGVSFTFLDFIRQRIEFIDPLQGLIEAFRLKYFTNLLLLKITKYLYIFLWSLLLVVPGVMKAYSYSQAEYIYKDIVDRTGVQPSAKECLQESERLMKGHRLDLFTLHLSFIGWYFLGFLTIGILFIWLNPYTTMAYTIFYENIAGSSYISDTDEEQTKNKVYRETTDPYEEIGQDPDDFRDFEDF
ncbi:MAG TPA: DUF975 family protein [Candidatus Atopostipes pullistercoris]|uniref:DUF975 family protein n=1 Tax=Candidatus Atopostipes pullistercoris TaxID=2838467 RepID=A0A9D2G1B3_9LACT|nr:DUF975 family protein [Candidatus Atopostipes pullistercoris]